MMYTLFFVLGQAGLFAAAVFSIGIIHLTAGLSTRPPWYYYVSVWLVACMSAFLFSGPFVSPRMEALPDAAYLLRFFFGVERTAVFIYYRYHVGSQLPARLILGINRYVGFVSVAAMLSVLTYGLYTRQPAGIEGQLSELKKEVRENRRIVISGDTARFLALQRQNDTLRREQTESRQTIENLTAQLAKANGRIAEVLDLVIELRVAIRRVGANVERSRKSNIYSPGFLSPKPLVPVLSPDRVRQLPVPLPVPKKYNRGGKYGFGMEAEETDSTRYARFRDN